MNKTPIWIFIPFRFLTKTIKLFQFDEPRDNIKQVLRKKKSRHPADNTSGKVYLNKQIIYLNVNIEQYFHLLNKTRIFGNIWRCVRIVDTRSTIYCIIIFIKEYKKTIFLGTNFKNEPAFIWFAQAEVNIEIET